MRLADRVHPSVGRGVALTSFVLLLAIAAGLPVYVCPQIDNPRRADAIFVLGGHGYERYKVGLELAEQGWASQVVVSNPGGVDDLRLIKYCDTPRIDISLDCFVPEPDRTKGEGRELAKLAQERGWHSVIVVTFRPHVSRARFILEKCFRGTLIMVESPARMTPLRWAYEYVYQTAGYVRSLVGSEC